MGASMPEHTHTPHTSCRGLFRIGQTKYGAKQEHKLPICYTSFCVWWDIAMRSYTHQSSVPFGGAPLAFVCLPSLHDRVCLHFMIGFGSDRVCLHFMIGSAFTSFGHHHLHNDKTELQYSAVECPAVECVQWSVLQWNA